ncbi:hypothetical protein SADUNF_Sadunf12G0058100 [Salix dunnii]|uniref:Uncharacterized protein n=1 Tax=Salix dunnii TaxID=1413687 RepID=A0A835MPF0_9ROSI|nr:hypothetical protein SADUNF_Sadunf12G0058100 [Salix dunnii]
MSSPEILLKMGQFLLIFDQLITVDSSQSVLKSNFKLLAEDPSLKRFKSHKKSVWRLKRFGDVLTLVVVAGNLILLSKPSLLQLLVFSYALVPGCCYEIYVKTVTREEARTKESA